MVVDRHLIFAERSEASAAARREARAKEEVRKRRRKRMKQVTARESEQREAVEAVYREQQQNTNKRFVRDGHLNLAPNLDSTL